MLRLNAHRNTSNSALIFHIGNPRRKWWRNDAYFLGLSRQWIPRPSNANEEIDAEAVSNVSIMIEPNQIIVHNQRWNEAVKAGGTTADIAVQAAINGSKIAVVEITKQLAELDYPVATTIIPCEDKLPQLISEINAKTGLEIPRPLLKIWQTIGGISLVDGVGYTHVEFWAERGITAEFCDGIVIDGCNSGWVSFILNEFEDWQSLDDRDREDFLLYLAPDGYHKDDISGGSPYGIRSGESWAPIWQNFRWPNKRPESTSSDTVDLIEYLRIAILECAGFPGLLGDEAFEPIRARLLKHVVPF